MQSFPPPPPPDSANFSMTKCLTSVTDRPTETMRNADHEVPKETVNVVNKFRPHKPDSLLSGNLIVYLFVININTVGDVYYPAHLDQHE